MSENFEIGCPKCGSTQITADKKGFSLGKAVTGAVLTGGIGLIGGFHGSGKVIITCLACGNRFKAGQGKKIPIKSTVEIPAQVNISIAEDELNRIECLVCKTDNSLNYKYCRKCGRELSDSDHRIHSDTIIKVQNCSKCNNLTPHDSIKCVHCGAPVMSTESSIGCIVVVVVIIFVALIFFLA